MLTDSSPVLSVRVSQSDILALAAEQASTNLSDFIRRKALDAAEMEVLDHRLVTAVDSVECPNRDVPGSRLRVGQACDLDRHDRGTLARRSSSSRERATSSGSSVPASSTRNGPIAVRRSSSQ